MVYHELIVTVNGMIVIKHDCNCVATCNYIVTKLLTNKLFPINIATTMYVANHVLDLLNIMRS